MLWPVQNPEHLVRKMDAYKRDRQARIAEAKAAHEYSELLDCTFTPAITRTVPQATGPVVVRGLERYMELQASAVWWSNCVMHLYVVLGKALTSRFMPSLFPLLANIQGQTTAMLHLKMQTAHMYSHNPLLSGLAALSLSHSCRGSYGALEFVHWALEQLIAMLFDPVHHHIRTVLAHKQKLLKTMVHKACNTIYSSCGF